MILRVYVPGIPMPPNALRREHWSVRAAEAKTFREAAAISARQAIRRSEIATGAPWSTIESASVGYIFVLPRVTGDLDGLVAAAKPILDGLVDAGVLGDDRVNVLRWLGATWTRGKERGVWIRVSTYREEEAT